MAAKESWGIEIGASAIKALHLVGDRKSGLAVANYEVLPFKTVITTPDAAAEEAVKVNLDTLVTRHDMSRAAVVLSVPGHMAFARFAKLPPVDPKKIPDIVRFEAQQQIPFPIDQVEWDYQVFAQEDSPDVEVGIFAITKDRVLQFLSNVRSVRLQPDALTLSPLAVYNAMAHDLSLTPTSPGVILMDIGTTSTDVIIVEGGRIWLRTLPIGGNNFTEALVRAFNLSIPKAEKLKREASTSKYARQIFQAMRPVFADLVQEMQRSIGYFQSLNRDAKIERLIGLGSTFRLPGLMKFLKQQLQIEVTRPDRFARLSVEGKQESDFAQHALNMATAYGLALQGLGMERVTANILPVHLLKQRLWKSKQPWIISAAAMVALATSLAGVSYWLNTRPDLNNQEQYSQQIAAIIDQADRNVRAIKEVKGEDRRQKIENLRRILDYRDVWPNIMLDIHRAFQAIQPQVELLSSDYEKWSLIPRNDRKLIEIESITTEYNFVWDEPEASEKKAVAVGIRPEDIWSNWQQPRTGGPMGPEGMGMGPGGIGGWRPGAPKPLTEQEQKFTEPTAKKPPSFIITIVGTTPHQKASELISHYVLKWLQDQPDEPHRPYTIIASDSFKKLIMLSDSTAPPRPGAGGLGLGGPTGSTQFRQVVPAGPRGGVDFMPMGPGVASGATEAKDLGPLLPVRPGQDEPRSRDWRFEIKFTVQLKPPDEARRAFRGDLRPAPAPAAPDADSPAPEQPAAALNEQEVRS